MAKTWTIACDGWAVCPPGRSFTSSGRSPPRWRPPTPRPSFTKPGNIYLLEIAGESDFVKVLDFGISKVRSASTKLTRTSSIMGTPNYMSPEQAKGKIEEIDETTDQWALACIAWECLSGEGPFVGENVPSILFQIVHEPTPSLLPKVAGLHPAEPTPKPELPAALAAPEPVAAPGPVIAPAAPATNVPTAHARRRDIKRKPAATVQTEWPSPIPAAKSGAVPAPTGKSPSKEDKWRVD
jgi:serine/threonine protein kinase